MSPGRHAADDSSFARSAGGALARGLALIIAAVVLGVVLLNATDEPEPFQAAGDGGGRPEGTTTVPGEDDVTPGEDDAEPSATTVAPPRDPSEVAVLVANATGRSGVAKQFSDQIAAQNYVTRPPSNAPPADASVIYFRPGFEAEAQAVAALLNPAPPVRPLPDPAPVDDLRDADVLLVVGSDLVG